MPPAKLGISKVQQGNRVVLVGEIAALLSVQEGDVVAFYQDSDGKIWLRKLE